MKDIELSEESKQRILEAQKRDALRNEFNRNNNYVSYSTSSNAKSKSKGGRFAFNLLVAVGSFTYGLFSGLLKDK